MRNEELVYPSLQQINPKPYQKLKGIKFVNDKWHSHMKETQKGITQKVGKLLNKQPEKGQILTINKYTINTSGLSKFNNYS